MKILIVTQYFWPEAFRINDAAIRLRRMGHEVTVLTGKPNYPAGDYYPGYTPFGKTHETWEGISIIRVPVITRGRGRALRLSLNYASFALSGSLLGPLLARGDYEAILVFQTSPITAALPALVLKSMRNIPVALWIQDIWPESVTSTGEVKSTTMLSGLRALVRYIYSKCDLILVQSRGFEASIHEIAPARRRIEYLPNWAEEHYVPHSGVAAAPDLAGLPPGFRIMFAGNLGAAQDLEIMLDAAEALRNQLQIQWVIVGNGRRRDWLVAEVARRGLGRSVHLLGHFRSEQMPALFAAADVMLVSLRPSEISHLTIPSKVQSYLASGMPIIACLDGEGAKVVREAEAGIVCPPGNSIALAAAVRTMADMPKERMRDMGDAGRNYYEREFQPDLLLSRLETWLGEISQCAS